VQVFFMVHAGEEPLNNGQLPMSYILENQRLRHWVGDGTSPSDAMFDAVARQKLTTRANHNLLKKAEPSSRQQLMGVDEEVKAHRKMMDDLKRATNFNQVELETVIKIFEEVALPDPVGTGKVLDRDALIKGFSQLEQHGLAQVDWSHSPLVDSFFATLDTNNGGTIDMKEFTVGIAMLTKGTLNDKIRFAFNCIDINNSGFLDRSELGDFLRCLIQAGPAVAGSTLVTTEQVQQMVTQAFAVMDVNNDEKISYEEFHTWATGQGHLISAAFS
jgi:Ca2+-binding EF-hand superfamily protein